MVSLPGLNCLYEFTVGESDVFRIGTREKESNMLWTIFVILLVLWALGLLTGYTMGGGHSCPAGHRHHRGADPGFSRTKTSVTIWTLAGQGEVFTERSNCYEKEEWVYRLFGP